jgi:hypothetical protein
VRHTTCKQTLLTLGGCSGELDLIDLIDLINKIYIYNRELAFFAAILCGVQMWT